MPAKRKGNRKNRRIKFSELNYVEKNYMQRGKAVIPVKLDKISDLYMKHDYKQMELSDSVCDYIEEIAYMVPINTDIIIEYDLSVNNKRALMFAIIGILLLIIHILIENFWRLFADFLSVIWWVAIWDMVEILILGNQEIKWKRLNNQQLYDSTVRFVFDDQETEENKEQSENVAL